MLLLLGGLLAAVLLYQGITSVVAYTDVAYVRSDRVAVAPQVTGQIVAIHVSNNQQVKQNDRLLSIDPVPFQLTVAERLAETNRSEAQLAVDRDDLSAAQDAYNGASADANFARETLQRTASLARTSDATQAQLDQANDTLARADTVAAARQANIARVRALLAVHEAALAAVRAALATAQWQLARTEIVAPVNGTINNLNLQPGDMATCRCSGSEAPPGSGSTAIRGIFIARGSPASHAGSAAARMRLHYCPTLLPPLTGYACSIAFQ